MADGGGSSDTQIDGSMDILRHSRSGHLGYVTKLYNAGELLLSDPKNIDEVQEHLKTVEKHFLRYMEAHSRLTQATTDANELAELNAHFTSHNSKYEAYIEHVSEWLEETRSMQPATDNPSEECTRMEVHHWQQLQAKMMSELERKQLELQQKLESQQKDFQERLIREIKQQSTEILSVENSEPSSVNLSHQKWSTDPAVGTLSPCNVYQNGPCMMSDQATTMTQSMSDTSSISQHFKRTFNNFSATMNEMMSLPKPELIIFTGNSLDFCKFISCFESNIERKLTDDILKLNYLIQYCSGEPRELISDCIILGNEGYARARQLLQSRYGKPHLVAQAHVQKLVNGPVIQHNDVKGLSQLSLDMTRAEITLSQLGYSGEINNSGNLRSIVNRLPPYIQGKWVERAYTITESGRYVSFSDLSKFVDERSQVANSMFGLDYLSQSKESSNASKLRVQTFVTTDDTLPESDRSTKCWCCKGSCERLDNCVRFKSFGLEQRRQYVFKNKLCYNCLVYKHTAKSCRKNSMCNVPNCNRKHNVLLHEWRVGVHYASDSVLQGVDSMNGDECEQNLQSTNSVTCSAIDAGKRICLRILPVRVINGERSVVTYALLDPGSDITLCDERLVSQLQLPKMKKTYTINTVNESKTVHGYEVGLSVHALDGSDNITVPKAWSVSKLPVSLIGVPKDQDIKSWRHLQGISIPEVAASDVMLLIGCDVPEVFWSLEERRGERKEPYAIRSILGWTILGPVSHEDGERSQTNVHVCFQQSEGEIIQRQLEKMWSFDFNDSRFTEKTMSIEDKRAYEVMETTAKLVNGHYELALPWRSDVNLPNNKPLAASRLLSLKRRLSVDEDLHRKYRDQVENYIAKGFALKVTEPHLTTRKTWYVPHNAVINPNKPNKVRVVFDCGAKYRGISLNDQLLHGPDLVNNLTGVLLRFRQDHIALMADIEGMFNQVHVTEKDSDSLRFLWWPGGDMDEQPVEYKMVVHTFGATSSPSCSAYALRRTASDNKPYYSEEAISTVERNFYVDDLLKSIDTPERAVKLVHELISLLQRGGFRLTKWISNGKQVLSSIPDAEKSPAVVDLDLDDDLPVERALGVKWNTQTDEFVFEVNPKDKPCTRRGILSVVAALYDPLGFVSPVTLTAKLLLQRLCREGAGWDDKVSSEDEAKWHQWLNDLHGLSAVRVSRCYKPLKFTAIATELHCFCDASEYGYGACIYLRLSNPPDICINLVIGKSRLAPLKQVSIPRMELCAAVLACQTFEAVICELDIRCTRVVFWTDSIVTLGYIRNTKSRFKTFVANRLSCIHEITLVDQWRYVPSAYNPADIASRGIRTSDAQSLKIWLHGPPFLWEEESKWPTAPEVLKDELQLEVKNIKPGGFVNNVDTNTVAAVDSLIAFYSSWFRLQRACAWLLRFKQYCVATYLHHDVFLSPKALSVEELRFAKNAIIRYVQRTEFDQEFTALQAGRHVMKSSKLASLAPILDDEMLKVGGRLGSSNFPLNQVHQIILPQRHTVTFLIIMSAHVLNGHVGPKHMLSILREEYWILCGLQSCKSVVKDCYRCLRRKPKPVSQMMGNLPQERLTPNKPPFSFVGIDYFGPLLVKVRRSVVKRYGCIFSCLTTRAVHLEVAHTLNTDSFLGAISRFISRRGRPDKVFSDNGTNMKSGEQELHLALKSWNQTNLNDQLLQRDIQWIFQPPHASHMGGVWERLIRSARDILGALADQPLINDEALLTLMAEVERILNSRPITQVSTDDTDPTALTPNMILLLRNANSLPYGIFSETDTYLRRWWRQAQYLANVFWQRWIKDYVPSLQRREKWQRSCKNLKVGDIVLMVDENVARGEWPLAVIKEVKYGRDGLVRSCRIRSGKSEYVRPIHKLCLLESSE